MESTTAKNTVLVPKEEYRFLKELYRTVKRQNLLLRIDQAEKNLKAGKIKKVLMSNFLDDL